MTKARNIPGIEEATQLSWQAWLAYLDEHDASTLDHKQIAALAFYKLDGEIESAGWWSQAVAVAYEQYIGRRVPGQKNDGSYELSVTKAIPGTKQDVFRLWNEAYGTAKDFNAMPIHDVRTSITPVRLYWRGDFDDASRLTIAVEQKTHEKAMISATHTKLDSEKAKDSWQRFWRETLDKL